MTSAVPEGYHSVTPYVIVPNTEEAMEFYTKAFGGTVVTRMPGPGGKGTMHAEMRIGNSHIMLSDENPQWEMKSAKTLGASPINFMLYLEDCDAAFDKAVAAGCEVKFPVSDQFWGDRMGKVLDPFGYQWNLATHKENVSAEELAVRQEKWFAEMQQQQSG